MPDILSKGFDKAERLLKKANGNMDSIPTTAANLLIIVSAQGVIDNGGYKYFFESDWPMQPPYSRFIEAYSAIGCEKQAADFARVVSSFPFDEPHLNAEKRNEFMDANYDEDEGIVKGWGDMLCGDEEVWSKLETYFLENVKDFA
jgi:hypothetical protein